MLLRWSEMDIPTWKCMELPPCCWFLENLRVWTGSGGNHETTPDPDLPSWFWIPPYAIATVISTTQKCTHPHETGPILNQASFRVHEKKFREGLLECALQMDLGRRDCVLENPDATLETQPCHCGIHAAAHHMPPVNLQHLSGASV